MYPNGGEERPMSGIHLDPVRSYLRDDSIGAGGQFDDYTTRRCYSCGSKAAAISAKKLNGGAPYVDMSGTGKHRQLPNGDQEKSLSAPHLNDELALGELPASNVTSSATTASHDLFMELSFTPRRDDDLRIAAIGGRIGGGGSGSSIGNNAGGKDFRGRASSGGSRDLRTKAASFSVRDVMAARIAVFGKKNAGSSGASTMSQNMAAADQRRPRTSTICQESLRPRTSSFGNVDLRPRASSGGNARFRDVFLQPDGLQRRFTGKAGKSRDSSESIGGTPGDYLDMQVAASSSSSSSSPSIKHQSTSERLARMPESSAYISMQPGSVSENSSYMDMTATSSTKCVGVQRSGDTGPIAATTNIDRQTQLPTSTDYANVGTRSGDDPYSAMTPGSMTGSAMKIREVSKETSPCAAMHSPQATVSQVVRESVSRVVEDNSYAMMAPTASRVVKESPLLKDDNSSYAMMNPALSKVEDSAYAMMNPVAPISRKAEESLYAAKNPARSRKVEDSAYAMMNPAAPVSRKAEDCPYAEMDPPAMRSSNPKQSQSLATGTVITSESTVPSIPVPFALAMPAQLHYASASVDSGERKLADVVPKSSSPTPTSATTGMSKKPDARSSVTYSLNPVTPAQMTTHEEISYATLDLAPPTDLPTVAGAVMQPMTARLHGASDASARRVHDHVYAQIDFGNKSEEQG